jgi:uncharacterized delta-60 repeat protein
MSRIPQIIPRLVRGLLPTTAVASGLLSPPAQASPGDIDPSFGAHGLVSLSGTLHGPVRSLLVRPDEGLLIAGGEPCYSFYYCDYYYHSFIGELSPDGALKQHSAAATLEQTLVFDFAWQADGKMVAVGMTLEEPAAFIVFRLQADGSLDTTFGDHGLRTLTQGVGGQAVLLEPGGNIVVAGSGNGQLVVARLLPNGTLDDSFAQAGVFWRQPNEIHYYTSRTKLLRTPAGAYRVLTNFHDADAAGGSGHCHVIGLTAAGALDATFGSAGIASLDAQPGTSTECHDMAQQPDGTLLLAGKQAGHGFAARLSGGGAADTSFDASSIPSAMDQATAVTVDAAGSVLVAGRPPQGLSGAVVVRLQASGVLDQLFGNDGSAWLDWPSSQGSSPVINAMTVLGDGNILAAGGLTDTAGDAAPILVRLLGNTGVEGPGLIGFTQASVIATEDSQQAIVTVHRTGGASGAVSVNYQTADYPGASAPATSGTDYTPVSGTLSWADGDRSDREIKVPIIKDTVQPEEPEQFMLQLTSGQGGATLGTQEVTIEIAGDGYPVGQFNFQETDLQVSEFNGSVPVTVIRSYSQGAASVTLTTHPGSATEADFGAVSTVLSWADGDTSPKTVNIPIKADNQAEGQESFTVVLSNPTNGAALGPHASATVLILAHDGGTGGGGGGGTFDWLALLSLSALRWLRRCVTGGARAAGRCPR